MKSDFLCGPFKLERAEIERTEDVHLTCDDKHPGQRHLAGVDLLGRFCQQKLQGLTAPVLARNQTNF